MTDLNVISGTLADGGDLSHAGTAGAISERPGSRTVPSFTASSAGTLRRVAIVETLGYVREYRYQSQRKYLVVLKNHIK